MAYVKVPMDLSRVKTKVLFHLTMRQLICFFAGGVVGFCWYFLTRRWIGSTMAVSIMILLILPFFLLAIYERDGKYLEQVLRKAVEWRWKTSRIRVYRTRNFFDLLQRELEEEKVIKANEGKKRNRPEIQGQSHAGKRPVRKGKAEAGANSPKGKKEKRQGEKRPGNNSV